MALSTAGRLPLNNNIEAIVSTGANVVKSIIDFFMPDEIRFSDFYGYSKPSTSVPPPVIPDDVELSVRFTGGSQSGSTTLANGTAYVVIDTVSGIPANTLQIGLSVNRTVRVVKQGGAPAGMLYSEVAAVNSNSSTNLLTLFRSLNTAISSTTISTYTDTIYFSHTITELTTNLINFPMEVINSVGFTYGTTTAQVQISSVWIDDGTSNATITRASTGYTAIIALPAL